MPVTAQQLYDVLTKLAIKTNLYTHQPLFTCQQAQEIDIPGAGCKNLFLKDSKKKLWLVVALHGTKVDLKSLGKQLGAKDLRFADANLLMEYLGVEPGSVTPFGLINDTQHALTIIFDDQLLKQELLQFHPLKNDATLTITPDDFKKFLAACQNQVISHTFAEQKN